MHENLFDKLHEECGVFGIRDGDTQTNVTAMTYVALYALQHRGQESCGIAVNDDGVIYSHKDTGLVNDVFNEQRLNQLGNGQMAIGHVRYGTTGQMLRCNAQPLVINHIKGNMALAHNGNLTNAGKLRRDLELAGAIFHTTSDTEVISYIITQERLKASSIEEAVCNAMGRLEGAYSLVVMSPTKLIAARDPRGFRPLCIGRTASGFVVSSEDCALHAVGAEFLRDVQPGEVVVFNDEGMRSLTKHCGTCPSSLCVFEYIYFARPDSTIDGSSVHLARQRAGAMLAKAHPVEADVVIGVPDSGLDAAMGYAQASGIPYGLGFIKNKYIGRTFIQPSQQMRENAVRIKLNPVISTVKDKRVVMIDDSIVRGTTCARIVALLRDAGAKEVHMRVTAPPFEYPCYFGTDIDSRDHLIAANHTVEEIADIIGVDSLGYLSVDDALHMAEHTSLGFCTGCFTGQYPIEVNADAEKNIFEHKISERHQITMDSL